MPDVSIIILNWNTRDLTLRCIQCVTDTCRDLDVEVIVVDNASSDDSVDALRGHYPHVRLIQNDRNVGFARANNQGVKACGAPYVLLLNSDAFLTQGALQAMLDVMKAVPKAAAVGALLHNADGTFQASHTPFPSLRREFFILSGIGRMLNGPWYPSHADERAKGAQRVDYVDGACILFRRDAYLRVGGLDEGYFMYSEEVDLCYRLKRSDMEVWYQPAATVIHIGGASSKHRLVEQERDMYRSRMRFFRKHYGAASALMLKAQLLGLTSVKAVAHSAARAFTNGKHPRRTVSLRDIVAL